MKILIVDDIEDARMILATSLEAAGYVVEVAHNGVQALDLVRRSQPDMIISDILMPEMDGFAFCRTVKSDDQLQTIPFIFYTATYVEAKDEKLALALGASRFIIKPIEMDKFLKVIEGVLTEYKEEGLPVPKRPKKEEQELERMYKEALTRKLDKKVRELEKERTALRESEEHIRLLLMSTGEAIYGIDLQGDCTFANPACFRILGYRDDQDLLGKNMHALIHHTRLDGSSYPEEECRAYQAFQEGKGKHVDDEVLWRRDGTRFPAEYWSYPMLKDKQLVGSVVTFLDITERKRAEEALRKALIEVEQLKNRLQAENKYLQDEIKIEHNLEQITSKNLVFKKVLRKVEQVAPTDSTVLILGETGTGKELIARALHNLSARKDRPLVKVNCAALPGSLIENELFGHEKGAFTGAISRKIGRFELADGGTLFLDEIGDLPLELQAKLLRVLQEGEFERVGGTQTLKVDVRVIAATNRDIRKGMEEKSFRADLYYRLNVFPISLPPLRERKDDIPLLTQYFLNKYAMRMDKQIKKINKETMRRLIAYSWPGNIRELENVIERAIIISKEPILEIEEELLPLSVRLAERDKQPKTLEEIQREYILKALEKTHWVIAGQKGAAKILKLHPNTLRSRMQKLNIE